MAARGLVYTGKLFRISMVSAASVMTATAAGLLYLRTRESSSPRKVRDMSDS